MLYRNCNKNELQPIGRNAEEVTVKMALRTVIFVYRHIDICPTLVYIYVYICLCIYMNVYMFVTLVRLLSSM